MTIQMMYNPFRRHTNYSHDTQTSIHVQLGHCIHTQAECRMCVSCDTFRCSRSLDTVCEVVIKVHDGLCIIEAEHVINSEVGYFVKLLMKLAEGSPMN